MTRKHLIIIGIVALGTALRVWHLADAPAWYTDEATHIEIAHRLLMGDIRYFAIQDSWLLFARLPLFEFLLASVFALTEVSLFALRCLTVTCGLLTVILLFFSLRDGDQDRLAIASATLFAIFPQAILYHRFGFSYNLLQPLIILMLWGSIRYQQTTTHRWLLLAVISLSLMMLTDVIAWSFLGCLLIMIVITHWRDALWAIPLASTPLLVYFGITWAISPEAFLFDLSYTLGRTGGASLSEQIALLAQNYRILLTHPMWLLAGIGIITLKKSILQRTLLIFLLPLLLIGRTVPLYTLSAYYLIPFLPLLAIAVGALLVQGWESLQTQSLMKRTLIVSVLIITIFMSLSQTFTLIRTGYPTEIDPFLIEASSAREVAAFLNQQVTDEQVIVTSAPIGWMLDPDLRVTEFQMVAIADGRDAVHIPATLPESRLRFQTTFAQADILVVDNLWRNWGAIHIPQVAEAIADLHNWQLIYEIGEIQVYQRIG